MVVSMFLFFLFLCCSQVHSNALKNVDSKCHDITVLQSRFMELNIECQLVIIENVDFTSLVSLVETNAHFRLLALDVFRRKFAGKTLKYVTTFGNVTEYDPSDMDDVFKFALFGIHSRTEDVITIKGFKTFSKVLKYFGHSISSLEVKMSGYDKDKNELKSLIELHCMETLTRLRIDSTDEQFFDYFSKPFKNVEQLSLAGHFDRLDTKKFTLETLFPAIRSLSFGDIQVSNASTIACEFQHLNDLQLFIDDDEDLERIPETEFRNLIKHNPQIRSMKIEHGDINLLKFVSDELKNLESLTLIYYNEWYPNGIQNVHFNNVKRFTNYYYSPQYLMFRNLVEFETNQDPKFFTKWSEYVKCNKHLQKLRWTGLYMGKNDFSDFVAKNSNLMEIHVICQADVDYAAIVDLLQKCDSLQILHLQFVKISTLEEPLKVLKELLRNDFRGKWTINEGAFWHEFTIERNVAVESINTK